MHINFFIVNYSQGIYLHNDTTLGSVSGSFHAKTDKKVPTLSELAIIDVMYSLPISVERSKISKSYLEPFRRNRGEELSISH